jgi:hypothetical protein
MTLDTLIEPENISNESDAMCSRLDAHFDGCDVVFTYDSCLFYSCQMARTIDGWVRTLLLRKGRINWPRFCFTPIFNRFERLLSKLNQIVDSNISCAIIQMIEEVIQGRHFAINSRHRSDDLFSFTGCPGRGMRVLNERRGGRWQLCTIHSNRFGTP